MLTSGQGTDCTTAPKLSAAGLLSGKQIMIQDRHKHRGKTGSLWGPICTTKLEPDNAVSVVRCPNNPSPIANSLLSAHYLDGSIC